MKLQNSHFYNMHLHKVLKIWFGSEGLKKYIILQAIFLLTAQEHGASTESIYQFQFDIRFYTQPDD